MDPSIESPRPEAPPARAASRLAFIFITAGLVAVASFVAFRGLARPPADAPANRAQIELAVDGMSCVGCAGTVETTLEDVPGVAEVTVDYEHRLAHIRLADPSVKPSVLIAAVEGAGYKARIEP